MRAGTLPPRGSHNSCTKNDQICTKNNMRARFYSCTVVSAYLISRNWTAEVEAFTNTTHRQREEFMPVWVLVLRARDARKMLEFWRKLAIWRAHYPHCVSFFGPRGFPDGAGAAVVAAFVVVVVGGGIFTFKLF